MRVIWVLAVVLTAGSAYAQPVSYQLKGVVSVGQKPQVRITAAEKVTDIRLDLERDDGKKFTLKQAALAQGQAVTLNIGDGAVGKASYKGTISATGSTKWSDSI